jgi:DNA modification methylase
MQKLGFSALPAILWRKQTNAPNKFMGSGMMPPGAYVTLEHEYILILRKGNKREFTSIKEKQNRRESAFFQEERNFWFSDVWMDLKGTTQNLFDNKATERSAAYPFELPYRLISMFSVKSDTV